MSHTQGLTEQAKAVLQKFGGSRLAIAEALLEDKLEPHDQKHLDEILNKSIKWAAKIRYQEKQKSSRNWSVTENHSCCRHH